jgi:hypothetical protein
MYELLSILEKEGSQFIIFPIFLSHMTRNILAIRNFLFGRNGSIA